MIKTIVSYVKEYKIYSLLCPIFVVIEITMDVLIPYLMSLIIDKGIRLGSRDDIMKYGIYLIITVVIAFLSGMISGYLATKASAGLAKNLRFAIFKNIQDFAFEDIESFSTGSLITRMTTDVQNIQASYQMANRLALRAPLLLIFAMIMSFNIHFSLSLTFMFTFPVLILGLAYIISHAHPLFVKIFKTYDDLNTMVSENLLGIRVVKSFVKEDHEIEKFHSLSKKLFRLYTKVSKLMAYAMPIMMLSTYVASLLIAYFGTGHILEGTLTTGQLVSLINYAVQIQISLMMLSFVVVQFIISRNSAERVVEVLNTKTGLDKNIDGLTEVKDGSIEFNAVCFSYLHDNSKYVLKDINFSISSGDSVGIIGPTGSSKSTLISLIPRLYDADCGVVSVGGINVKDYNLKNLRDAVSVVLQKNTLFSGSILDNLKWGDVNATLDQVQEAAKLAQAHNFIMDTENGYDTKVDRGGANFSGGQRQRLSIARSLLKNPKILILDDSTSALDNETEKKIIDGLNKFRPDLTKIIISQRINSLKNTDYILVVDKGRINKIGTHQELLDTNEIYQDIAKTQIGGDFDA
ncbi:ABC transporter ATP-binding protein [Peptoniphilus indolicus]|uniref:Multidrug resistance ABC superfamily ATP binding cassette transporter, ABC/membrane protein n=2 Tax=Peptoniphilus indolicus TaxID=33030 RepID=G4D1J9_9FIRM|nr:ABC transporter ATP-binding protein [Peptoniphilus indolicus]EGY80648.1 multidrug resistance ABC superfamily ATP binding cassette transporter, ABC/membrane protein [Peptoniphilus indolicus ATCC 29427]SUB74969.1 Putative multidrug export ATP-binding/permease protein SAV1866 [Peptoniphilus indolicus]